MYGGFMMCDNSHDNAKEVELCNERNERVSVHVTARQEGKCLIISGVDCGQTVEDIWGDDDYEYWYSFDEENTALLFGKLSAPDVSPLIALKERFCGMDGCRQLREFCDSEGISYHFDSWV